MVFTESNRTGVDGPVDLFRAWRTPFLTVKFKASVIASRAI